VGRADAGGWDRLLQPRRAQLRRLDETDDLVLVNDRQTTIHAVMKGNPPVGEVEANRPARQGDGLTKQTDAVVLGHSLPVSEMDLLVGLGQGKPGAVGRAGFGC